MCYNLFKGGFITADYERINRLKKQKKYLKVARSTLNRYLKDVSYLPYDNPNNKPFYYLIEDKLIIANGFNVYIFNNDELLTTKQKNKLDDKYKERALKIYHEFQRFDEMLQFPVLDFDKDNLGKVMLGTNNEVQEFYIDNFSPAKKLLGESTEYYLCKRNDACIAKSEKGKGLILGAGKSFY